MAQLTIQVNAKPYVVGCEDGEEAHLVALAALLDEKARGAAAGAGQVGETRVMLLGALILADDLVEAKAALAAAQGRVAALEEEQRRAEERTVAALEAAAHKLEAMATGSNP